LLRLEKRHAIVGVDTDALADPYAAGMGWAAKLEKESFVGKLALSRAAARSPRERLVGFVIPGERIPADGSAVVVDGKPAGRVTSARYSPAQKAAIGLAWVPSEKAEEGASIQVRIEGQLTRASVTMNAFYDPQGTRLRQ
jgi:glycine cleavage system aminomethyltransferase T